MTEEIPGTCRARVGARLQNDNEVANVSFGEQHVVDDAIKRSARAADDVTSLSRCIAEPIAEYHWQIAAQYLPEVARGREVVVQAAVGDKEGGAA
ncbi:hypothetical protein WQ49_20220 [Burkholderia cenocepacia]|nr:hypothetical protein WQ49_20220 [Burkholderia cenocepacia]